MSLELAGIYPAFLTPLDDERHVVPSVAEALLAHLLEAGVSGVYATGSTGEGMRLSLRDRETLVETLARQMPADRRLIVHVGSHEIRDAVRLAGHAARHGAHAVSSLPPPGDARDLMRYYRTLAAESELPLIVYYFPGAVPAAFADAESLFELCEVPNVLGFKFTDFNLYLLQQLTLRGRLVFNGYDEALAAGLLMGAHGGIGSTYNLMPQLYLEIYRAAQSGDWETARTWQARANVVLSILLRYPFLPALRAAMACRGFDCGPLMSGEEFASPAQRAAFLDDLNRNLPTEVASLIGWPAPAGEVEIGA